MTKKECLISYVCSKPKKQNINFIDNPKFDECGEDSYFINSDCIGICDGVGGWNYYGVNPALIARQMCLNAKEYSNLTINPLEIMTYSYQKIILNNEVESGSTTCCILSINDNIITSSNIGDCQYIVIRNNNMIFKSNIHRFEDNSIKQLAIIPEKYKNINAISNCPNESIIESFNVKNNDIIIMATDGLWDNIFLNDIYHIINNCEDNKSIAQELLRMALIYNFKPDDITIIVSKIVI